MDNRVQYRSLFWPVVLIGVGVIWLLSNLGYVTPNHLWEIWRLWPLLLIAGGLDLLIGRRLPIAGALIGLLVIGVVGVFLLSDVRLPGTPQANVVSERYHLPVDQARLAHVSLNFWSDPVHVFALKDSTELIDAQVTHTGQIDFRGSGQDEKTVHLSHQSSPTQGFFWLDAPNRRADVGLTGTIPLDLSINTRSGSSDLDLTGLQMNQLVVDSGSGSINMTLPESAAAYSATISSGSGSVNLTIPETANANLELDSGSGSVHVRLLGNPAVRIEIRDNGSGSIRLPSELVQTVAGDGDQGVWETAGFASAQNKTVITIVGFGSGSLTVTG
jgi:hypothetical protein